MQYNHFWDKGTLVQNHEHLCSQTVSLWNINILGVIIPYCYDFLQYTSSLICCDTLHSIFCNQTQYLGNGDVVESSHLMNKSSFKRGISQTS